MAAISQRDAIYSILHYLDLNNLGETARTLERESGLFFSFPYFEECFIHGEFDEAEEYFNGFTTVHDNIYSTKVIFELRWHKFLEALEDNNYEEANELLHEELTTFLPYNQNLIAQATEIMNLHDVSIYLRLQDYGDLMEAKSAAMINIRRSLEANPRLVGKIRYRIPNHYSSGGVANLPVVLQIPRASPAALQPPTTPLLVQVHFRLVPGFGYWVVINVIRRQDIV
ncbi:hypothetical protein FF1_043636 [Malus domestica]|uniref:CTLH domain-containing protein n=1 Tax=Malus domestica TaxID=3750 RepID=A0A498JEF2_MALDO|nr:hypothetical protein DVH24_021135 [Malus domestica]